MSTTLRKIIRSEWNWFPAMIGNSMFDGSAQTRCCHLNELSITIRQREAAIDRIIPVLTQWSAFGDTVLSLRQFQRCHILFCLYFVLHYYVMFLKLSSAKGLNVVRLFIAFKTQTELLTYSLNVFFISDIIYVALCLRSILCHSDIKIHRVGTSNLVDYWIQ